MLGFLPSPIGDELLYSLLARYRVLSGAASSKPILVAAFGSDQRYAYTLLPGGLANLVRAVPGIGFTADELVNRATVFPYYARFLPPEAYERGMRGLLEGWTHGGYNGLNTTFAQAKNHAALNFCPSCVEEDQATFGMSAWRRTHQLPGVYVCPEHGDALRSTDVRAKDLSRLDPCPADPGAGRPIVSPLGHGAAALNVACNSQWLLLNPVPPMSPGRVRAGVRALLLETDWLATPDGFVRNGLREAMGRKFGHANLEAMGCRLGVTGDREAWLGSLWEKRDRIRAHPLRYLLLLSFFERDVASLLSVPEPAPGAHPERRERWYHRHDEATVRRYKRQALALIAANPAAGRTELRKLDDRPFLYLACHEPDWIDERLPARLSKATVRDYTAIDAALLPEVQAVIARLRAEPGRPVRISFRRIAVAGDMRSSLQKNEADLPLSAAAARAASEDEVSFAKRRLDWAANEILARNGPASWSDLTALGKLSGPWRPALEDYAKELFLRLQDARATGAKSVRFPHYLPEAVSDVRAHPDPVDQE